MGKVSTLTRSMLFAIGLALSCVAMAGEPAPSVVGKPQVLLTMRLDGWVDIDAAGKVAGYQMDVPVPEDLRANVDRAIRGWLFESVAIGEGKDIARARMRLTLRAEPQGEGYAARIVNVVFPPTDAKTSTDAAAPSTAPIAVKSTRKPKMMLAGIAAGTLVAIKVGLDGRVEDAVAVQSMVMDDDKAAFISVMPFVEKSILEAVRKWKFRVDFGGKAPTPEMQTMLVAMFFNPDLTEAGVDQGVWHRQAVSPRRTIPWLPTGGASAPIGVADASNGDLLPLIADGAPRLRPGIAH